MKEEGRKEVGEEERKDGRDEGPWAISYSGRKDKGSVTI